MIFACPWALIGLLGVAYLALRQVRPGKSGSGRVRYSDLRLLETASGTARAKMSSLLPPLRMIALGLLVVGLARPEVPVGVKRTAGAGIDIILTLDISGSMEIKDLGPQSRFHVAKEVLSDFIDRAGQNRLGLVVFARQAFTQAPLTADHKMVRALLDEVEVGMLPDGTAIGMAIATSASRLRNSEAKSKVIILLTDGANNAGEIDPVTAARTAAALGLKIYAIGVGGKGVASQPGFPFGVGKPAGTQLDEETLRKVAGEAGQYFRATDADTLRQIYAQIEKMEKSEYLGQRQIEYKQLYGQFVWPAFVILLLQFILGCTWLRKAP